MAKIACCHNCAYSYWDRDHTLSCMSVGVMNWPACANHPESLGRMQRVPARGICRNYRPRPATPEGEVKQIPLGDGYYAYVDAMDYEWLSRWTWHLHGGYAARWESGKCILMHREIMQPGKRMIVDHANRNKLDNTRDNLRVCTRRENTHNKGKHHGTSSSFKGVAYHKRLGKWYARLCCEGRHLFLGYFDKEVEAARAYDRAAAKYFGEFARLNFPEEWPRERRQEVYARREAGREKEGKKAKRAAGKRTMPGGKRREKAKPRSRSPEAKKRPRTRPARRETRALAPATRVRATKKP